MLKFLVFFLNMRKLNILFEMKILVRESKKGKSCSRRYKMIIGEMGGYEKCYIWDYN